MAETERKYRRKTHYPGHLSASVTIPTQKAVEGLADQAGWSVAEAVRECIEVGLPVVKSRLTPVRDGNEEAPVDNS